MKSDHFLIYKAKDEKGTLLIVSYFVVAVLSIFSLAMFSRTNTFFDATARNRNQIVAFNAAEAAVDLAIVQIAADNDYLGSGGYTAFSSGYSEGGYDITVCSAASACPGGYTTPTDPNVRAIIAVGYSPNDTVTSRAYASRSNVVYTQITVDSLFNFGVFADNEVALNGNTVVDSYDSSLGAYNPLAANSNGDVGTNSTANGDVGLVGNASVKGDVAVGPGGNPASVISLGTGATITGTSSAAPTAKTFSAITIPGSAINLGDLNVVGNSTYNLSGGIYEIDELTIRGNGLLNVTGSVTIYVTGGVDISGNGVSTASNLPPNFIVYYTGTNDVKVAGNGNFYGAIYAPHAEVRANGNGSIYGAVVSESFRVIGNGAIHYDEALDNAVGNGGGQVSVLSWVEEGRLLQS